MDVEAQPGGGVQGDVGGRILAAVEHQHGLKPRAWQRLRGNALEAAGDLRLLVARRDDHHRAKLAQRHSAPSAISRLPLS